MLVTRLLLVVCALVSSGCYNRATRIPGVLDLRSDGLDAKPIDSQDSPSDARRTGVAGVVKGRGLRTHGEIVTVEDRAYWWFGLFPVFNADAEPELTDALTLNPVLRDVRIHERVTMFDVALFFIKFIPCVNIVSFWVVPSFTLMLVGTNVEVPKAPLVSPAPPDDVETAPPTGTEVQE